jgi:hypothetical protein
MEWNQNHRLSGFVLWEEKVNEFQMFENRVVWKIFGPEKGEVWSSQEIVEFAYELYFPIPVGIFNIP